MSNEDQYLEVVKALDPELYMIKIALQETGVNAQILPRIIRSLGNLNVGTGYGQIIIHLRSRIVTQIQANESDILNLNVDQEEVQ